MVEKLPTYSHRAREVERELSVPRWMPMFGVVHFGPKWNFVIVLSLKDVLEGGGGRSI